MKKVYVTEKIDFNEIQKMSSKLAIKEYRRLIKASTSKNDLNIIFFSLNVSQRPIFEEDFSNKIDELENA